MTNCPFIATDTPGVWLCHDCKQATPEKLRFDKPPRRNCKIDVPIDYTYPCIHRLAATGDTLACPTCNGSVQVKVFGCAELGECTVAKPVEKNGETLAVCALCRLRVRTE